MDDLPALAVSPAQAAALLGVAFQPALVDVALDWCGRAALEQRSHGIVPGVIQVPPSGQPIIQLRDAQPSGGYPKIGTVIEADLWRLAQA